MEVTEKDINHLAKLSNLSLELAEKTVLKRDIANILKYISKLDELDTSGVEPTYQVFEMENIWRSDDIKSQDADREALLSLTKEERDHQIKVPKVL
ncbi:Asp-tRNA(Asn)/Glu-tRNA(Gln) amidotransferase subunit GatC [Candidatus Saccharibacteria bacterium]|nr:Asp-tRNA(Asn)/Glu-tRNA(Gln) amidotransferase subunit GatC [Candidatus Saccharibacteria bacterium]